MQDEVETGATAEVVGKDQRKTIPSRLGKTTPGINIVNTVRLTNQDVIYEVWGLPMTALTHCID
jgi:hypothetical protein